MVEVKKLLENKPQDFRGYTYNEGLQFHIVEFYLISQTNVNFGASNLHAFFNKIHSINEIHDFNISIKLISILRKMGHNNIESNRYQSYNILYLKEKNITI